MSSSPLISLYCLRAVLGGLVLALGLPVPVAQAGGLPWEHTQLPADPGWEWAPPVHFEWPSASLVVKPFKAPNGLPSSAGAFAARMGWHFDRMQFSARGMQLSGLWRGRHWLLHLQSVAVGTHGVLSVLSPRLPGQATPDLQQHVPAGCVPVLRIATRASAGLEQLLACRCRDSLPAVMRHVQKSVQARGWKQLAALDHGQGPVAPVLLNDPERSTSWLHAGFDAMLDVLVRPTGQDTTLVLWLRPKGS